MERQNADTGPFVGAIVLIKRASDKILLWQGYACGVAWLALAIFITVEVTSRYLGGYFTGVSDEISSYVLAFSGTWALAYTLSIGGHVQIDLIVEKFSDKARKIIAVAAAIVTFLIASLYAYQTWLLAIDSYQNNIRSISTLATPIYLPQSLVAIGLTMLAVQAVIQAFWSAVAGDQGQTQLTAV
ncbi:TRAP-type C4-dicarboxylate transport system permease small subunit [Aminobacter lissarensis]|uniref:TRAP transporter small permease protein n=1 Tax=Aminobacter carboxidus TaxID=376165 RepID=A0A8E1WKN7_9HYPH|nr:TRAP transporter small permease [Aminobacter lissarensis]MBB6469106.1 TRAP-type C4-dicarboxylate transport system permease small subunit [Aminobacter lissarensis]